MMRRSDNTPFISCIVTTYNEGPLAAASIQSLLDQSFEDFELLIVDDGASDQTRAAIHAFDDPRIRYIRQANDGLSSARNRALHHVRGDYVCFLDADDIRPLWALAEMAKTARETAVDCIFLPGLLCELRNDVLPFYDQLVFERLVQEQLEHGSSSSPGFIEGLRYLAALEPQSANKLVKRSFLEAHKIRFPSGLFFEDMVFHQGVVVNMESYATVSIPCFTYFRRYGRPQITSSTNLVRFDAVSSAANTLGLFERSRYFQDIVMRLVVIASTFKLLKWCEESVSHHHKWAYRQAILAMMSSLDERFFRREKDVYRLSAERVAPWVRQSLDYFFSLKEKR